MRDLKESKRRSLAVLVAICFTFLVPFSSLASEGYGRGLSIRPSCVRGTPTFSRSLKRALILRGEIASNLGAGEDTIFLLARLRTAISHCGFRSSEIATSNAQLDQWTKTSLAIYRIKTQERLKEEFRWGGSSSLQDFQFLTKHFANPDVATSSWLERALRIDKAAAAREQAICGKPVDLSARFGPSRDQDSTGWCAAFAASDLFSFKTGKVISAADIALTYYGSQGRLETNESTKLSGATVLGTLEAAKSKGLCLESKFRSDDNGGSSIKQALETIERVKDRWEKMAICGMDLNSIRRIFPALTEASAIRSFLPGRAPNFLSSLGEYACGNRIRPNISFSRTAVKDLSTNERVKLLNAIGKQIDSANPVIAEIDSRYLEDRNSLPDPSEAGTHGVLVIGKKFNPQSQKCEYLVRNSWGTSCREFSCDTKGHVWVPREYLFQGLTGATYAK